MAPDHLRSVKSPWVHLVVLDQGQKPERLLAAPAGFVSRTVDGRRARTKRGLLAEFARALEFPADSGRNWDAFEELLADLEWLPAKGYLLIVIDADEMLAEDADEYDTFIEIATSVAKEWATARPPVPFHLCLTTLRQRAAARADWRVPRLSIERARE